MLHRIIYASDTLGATGVSSLSIAQIVGVSERNNRRDEVTSGVMFHAGGCLQAIEGRRPDVDRLMRRLEQDRRHTNLRVLVDRPIFERRFDQRMELCPAPSAMLDLIGARDIGTITAADAERIVELKLAA